MGEKCYLAQPDRVQDMVLMALDLLVQIMECRNPAMAGFSFSVAPPLER